MTWRLPPVVRSVWDVTAVFLTGVGLLVLGSGFRLSVVTSWLSVTGSNASNIALGVFVVGFAGPLTAVLSRRVRLDLSDSSLLVQNRFRSYRVELSEVVSVTPGDFGVVVVYNRDGRKRSLIATAGQGVLNPMLFTRKAVRSRSVADAITERLPSNSEKAEPSS
jgi:hypothetical protein